MKHFRIIKICDGYIIQRRYRFLFWKHWVSLDRYGNDEGPYHAQCYSTFDGADTALDNIVAKHTKCNPDKYADEIEVIKEITI